MVYLLQLRYKFKLQKKTLKRLRYLLCIVRRNTVYSDSVLAILSFIVLNCLGSRGNSSFPGNPSVIFQLIGDNLVIYFFICKVKKILRCPWKLKKLAFYMRAFVSFCIYLHSKMMLVPFKAKNHWPCKEAKIIHLKKTNFHKNHFLK